MNDMDKVPSEMDCCPSEKISMEGWDNAPRNTQDDTASKRNAEQKGATEGQCRSSNDILAAIIQCLVRTASSTLIYGSADLSTFAVKLTSFWATQSYAQVCYYTEKTTLPIRIAQENPGFLPSQRLRYCVKKIDERPWNISTDVNMWNVGCRLMVFDGFQALEQLSQTSIYSQLVVSAEQLKSLFCSPWILLPKTKLGHNHRPDQWDNILRVDNRLQANPHSRQFLVTVEKALYYDSLPSAHFIFCNQNSAVGYIKRFGGKYQDYEMTVRKLTKQGKTGKQILEMLRFVAGPDEGKFAIPSLYMLNRLKRQWDIKTYQSHRSPKKQSPSPRERRARGILS